MYTFTLKGFTEAGLLRLNVWSGVGSSDIFTDSTEWESSSAGFLVLPVPVPGDTAAPCYTKY